MTASSGAPSAIRQTGIRCDGTFPCAQCADASLACICDHVPRMRRPKDGRACVIDESRASSDIGSRGLILGPSRPTPSSPLCLLPRLVALYALHIYPVMPLVYLPDVRQAAARAEAAMTMAAGRGPSIVGDGISAALSPREKSLLYAMCALTALHVGSRSIDKDGLVPESLADVAAAAANGEGGGGRTAADAKSSCEPVGRWFLNACLAARKGDGADQLRYDMVDDPVLDDVITSFWLSTSFFEIGQKRRGYHHLREALTLALDLGLDNEQTYHRPGLTQREVLCRRRVFWSLFVAERSHAVLYNKPLVLTATPGFPDTRHVYESPEIHAGFLKLVSVYAHLDAAFVGAWNDGINAAGPATAGGGLTSGAATVNTTYLALQDVLGRAPEFVLRGGVGGRLANLPVGSSAVAAKAIMLTENYDDYDDEGSAERATPPRTNSGALVATTVSSIAAPEPELTEIQKADLLVTQQWLRLVVWQASFRQGLLSWKHAHEAMRFGFPLAIAHRTAACLAALPAHAFEAHGMGVMEKVFRIGAWCVDVTAAADRLGRAGAGDGARGVAVAGLDPLQFFVRTLSASPASRSRFAEKLLMLAADRRGPMALMVLPPRLGAGLSVREATAVVEELGARKTRPDIVADQDHAARSACNGNPDNGAGRMGPITDEVAPGFYAASDNKLMASARPRCRACPGGGTLMAPPDGTSTPSRHQGVHAAADAQSLSGRCSEVNIWDMSSPVCYATEQWYF